MCDVVRYGDCVSGKIEVVRVLKGGQNGKILEIIRHQVDEVCEEDICNGYRSPTCLYDLCYCMLGTLPLHINSTFFPSNLAKTANINYAATIPTLLAPKDLPNPRRRGGPVPFPVVIFNRFLLASPPLSSPCEDFSSTQAIFSIR